MTKKTFKKTLLSASIFSIAFGLTGCGGEPAGDSGTTNNIQMSGAVVDDTLAFARVYIDVNENNKYDPSSESAYATIADKDGNYTLNVNEATLNQFKSNGFKIKVENGRDNLTSRLYNAMLASDITVTSEKQVVSALTLAKAVVSIYADDIKDVLSSSGKTLTADSLDAFYKAYLSKDTNTTFNINKVNPMELADNENLNADGAKSFKLGVQIHKLAETIDATLTKSLKDADANTDIQTTVIFASAIAGLLTALAEDGLLETTSASDPFSGLTDATIAKAFTHTYTLFNKISGASIKDRSARVITPSIPAKSFTSIETSVTNTSALNKAVNTALPVEDTTNSFPVTNNNARLKMISLEIMTKTTREKQTAGGSISQQSLDNAISMANDPDAKNLSQLDVDLMIASMDMESTQAAIETAGAGTDFISSGGTATVGQTLAFSEAFIDAITSTANADQTNVGKFDVKDGATTTDRIRFVLSRATNTDQDGSIRICYLPKDKTSADDLQTLGGKWNINADKKYQITLQPELLPSDIVLSLLDNNNTTCKTENNGTAPKTCLKVSYNISNSPTDQYFVDANQALTDGGGYFSSATYTNKVPSNANFCQDNFTQLFPSN